MPRKRINNCPSWDEHWGCAISPMKNCASCANADWHYIENVNEKKGKIAMIKENMFFTEPTIKDYREMDIREIIREYLLTKGTWTRHIWKAEPPKPTNKVVNKKDLVSSGLFVYGLKDNPTNKRAIEYYCERWGHIHQIIDEKGDIQIPDDLWEECDKYNEEHTNGKDRKPKEE